MVTPLKMKFLPWKLLKSRKTLQTIVVLQAVL